MQTQKIENGKLEMVDKFVRYTNMNIFLTGKAGTGKTTFLRSLAEKPTKRMVILAPTGVAAINAGGQTIHSFFQLEFGPQIPEDSAGRDAIHRVSAVQYQKMSAVKLKIIRSLELLVIDEISMVRADLLDAVDTVMRRVRRNDKPFGGVQVLMIGDIHQLAPVAKEEEWALLRDYYKSVYFFDSHVLTKTPYCCIELEHIYRQEDRHFIDILNKVRNNCLDTVSLNVLNSHYNPDFEPADEDGYITLMTHNRQVDEINDGKLNALKTRPLIFTAKVFGNFPESSYPTKFELELKIGAQVMFVKNDPSPEKAYFNGKIGQIVGYDEDDGLQVRCGDEVIDVQQVTWSNFEYKINEETKEIEEKEVGSFTQIPLKLAWAITIHKSQGLTFDKVILDASLAFTHGQVYVALSRCTSLEGLVLKAKLSQSGLFNDLTINKFVAELPSKEPNEEQFEYNRKLYESQMLFELIDFHDIESDLNGIRKVVFANKGSFDSSVSEKISPLGQKFHEEVVEVSEKFKRQIGGILKDNFQIDNNIQLQERVKKGCSYFLDKLSDLDEISDLPFETDNKAVNDQIKKELDAFQTDFFVKKACLECCLGGFEMKKYLAVKNKKTVEAEELNKTKKSRLSRKQLSRDDNKLFKALVAWREQVADALEVTETKVIPTTTLTAIAEKKPMSVKELKSLSKIGATRLQRFGADILNIVLEHQGFKKQEFNDEESKEELELGASVQRTKELIEEGFSIDAIAEKRSMAKSTIEQHVAELVLKGYADAKDFMSEEHYETIKEYFEETQDFSLGAAKDVIGEDYSWGELRIALNEMKRDK